MKISQINNFRSVNYVSAANNYNKREDYKQIYKQLDGISNICYKPVSFGWSMAEHKDNGAFIDPETKEVSFKLFTFPDAKKVTVTVIDKDNEEKRNTYELQNKGNGIFKTPEKIPSTEAKHGDRYFYTIYKSNGEVDEVKDPYAFRQESLDKPSTLYDHSLYDWHDLEWFKSDKSRISRKANNNNGLTPVSGLKIYELHIGTITKKGTFESAKAKLKNIKDMGFNAIEMMPVENTFSFNWGYDGVDKFAPSEHLGGPDGLKGLIDYAHSIGLNVIMDMVPNHAGPDGNYLERSGPYLTSSEEDKWGDSFNYEGKDSRYVRDYMVNVALNWINNYHCDGLRLDMTKHMKSDYTMKMIAAELNNHNSDAFLIAEDAREKISVDEHGNYWHNDDEIHDKRVTNPLKAYESGEGLSEQEHIAAIQKLTEMGRDVNLGRIGFDSEWDFNYFHSLKDALYDVVDLDRLEKASYCAQKSTKYVMSHDEKGNHEGTSLIAKLMVPMLHLTENMTSDEHITRDAQFAAEKLATMLQTGELNKYNTSGITSKRLVRQTEQAFYNEVIKPLGISEDCNISYDSIKTAFERSYNKNKMAYARTYSIPGPIMVFQGDESQDLTPFRFFREFQSIKNEESLYKEKGYNTGKSAFLQSKMGRIKYSPTGRNTMNKFKSLIKDLNKIHEQNPALVNGYLIADQTIKHPYSKIMATLAKKDDNEVYSITNFSDFDYPRDNADCYYIKFPKGKWVEVLNTDDKKYNGTGLVNSQMIINSNGETNSRINLAGNSTAMFVKVQE